MQKVIRDCDEQADEDTGIQQMPAWRSYRIISKPDCSIDNLPQDVMSLNIKEMEWVEMFIAR